MADTFTAFWGVTKPEVGSSRDSWGTKLNADLDAIDTLLQALQPIGAMTDFAGADAPIGWLLCDGTVYTATAYPRLFAVIGNRYGGDGVSTFAVPDLRARTTTGVGSTTGDFGYSMTITLGMQFGDYAIAIAQSNLPSGANITTDAVGGHTHAGSVSDFMGPHSHPGTTDAVGDHTHNYGAVLLHNGDQQVAGGFDSGFAGQNTGPAGSHAHSFNTGYAGSHQHALAITADGAHSHSFGLGGSDVPLRVLPPSFGVTKIICCGPPSMQTLAAGLAADGTARLMASPLRGMN